MADKAIFDSRMLYVWICKTAIVRKTDQSCFMDSSLIVKLVTKIEEREREDIKIKFLGSYFREIERVRITYL